MKEKVEGSNGELQATLQKIGTYDKTLSLAQARINQATKDIKSLKETLGEEIYNVDQRTQEQGKVFGDSLVLLKKEFESQIKEKDESYTERMREQLRTIEIMIRDEIRASLPDYNMKIMDKVSEMIAVQRDTGLMLIGRLQETVDSKFGEVDKQLFHLDLKHIEDGKRRDGILHSFDEKFVAQVKDLNDLIELRYQKKQKTKVDFFLEIKNMHAQMRIYEEKIKETKEVTEVIVELYHYVKVLECDITRMTQQLKFSHQWLIHTAGELSGGTTGWTAGRRNTLKPSDLPNIRQATNSIQVVE